MKKKLHLLYLLPVLLIGFLFSSCEGDKYYYEDPSYSWESHPFIVDANGGTNKGKWVWNSTDGRYECVFNLTGQYENEDKFIYNNGFFSGFVFFGQQNVNETQNPMPFEDKVNKAKLTYDTSFALLDNGGHELTVCFYFEWKDGRQAPPPLYNFRLYLGWGK